MLEKYVKDVLGGTVLFENSREVVETLKKYNIRHREWAGKIAVEKIDLANLPEDELEAVLKKVKELDKSSRVLIGPRGHSVRTQSSSNIIVLDSEQRPASQQSSKVLIRSNRSISSRRLLELGLSYINDEEVRKIIEAALRAPRRKTTSIYIDVDLWDTFLNTLEALGIDKRRAHVVIELLIAKFIEGSKSLFSNFENRKIFKTEFSNFENGD